jgi:hypothetical protein
MAAKTKEFDYEFGGPIGTLATMIFLPLITLLLTYWASIGQLELTNIHVLLSTRHFILHDGILCKLSCAMPILS